MLKPKSILIGMVALFMLIAAVGQITAKRHEPDGPIALSHAEQATRPMLTEFSGALALTNQAVSAESLPTSKPPPAPPAWSPGSPNYADLGVLPAI